VGVEYGRKEGVIDGNGDGKDDGDELEQG
jgi:hypothetical protein